jgi:hypothetical protein
MRRVNVLIVGALCCCASAGIAAQVDTARAKTYFAEIARLCARDAGRIWGTSLCGPVALVDPATNTMATSEPPPAAKRPPAFGFANAAMDWGGTRWSTVAWSYIPADPYLRGRLFMHELFHRVQPQLGLFLQELGNDHLDTKDGRYWLQLEWRALAAALGTTGNARDAAIRDALAFRARRRQLVAGSAESERRLEINEGLAQYTGTVVASATSEDARFDAIGQLMNAQLSASFVRTFAYTSVAAYGLLLDAASPGWPRRIKSTDDIGDLLAAAAKVTATTDVDAALKRYGGAELSLLEDLRETQRAARVADLKKKFVDGPILRIPRARTATFVTTDATPIPGAGVVFSSYRVADAEWGNLSGGRVLVGADQTSLIVPGPWTRSGNTLTGSDWSVTLAPGWIVQPDAREGDFRLAKGSSPPSRQ